MLITSVFGGLLIGLVDEGSERAGLRFIPILLGLSLCVYFVSRIFITQILGSMIL
jgi:archaellum biogenesis protein FlaJ (TadC family)